MISPKQQRRVIRKAFRRFRRERRITGCLRTHTGAIVAYPDPTYPWPAFVLAAAPTFVNLQLGFVVVPRAD